MTAQPYQLEPQSDALEAIEGAIAALTFVETDDSAATAYVFLDRLDQYVHDGVILQSVATENTGRTDEREFVWLVDTVEVTLRIDCSRVLGQRALRRLATDHEARIRRCVLETTQSRRPSYVRTDRAVLPGAQWLEVRQTFTFERFELAHVSAGPSTGEFVEEAP